MKVVRIRMEYIITLDVGTTAMKACLFDCNLNLLASSNKEYNLYTPHPNIVELDPEQYWEGAKSSIRELLDEYHIISGKVEVITITTQGDTLIPVNNRGEALYNAIVWLDNRAVQETAIIRDIVPDMDFYRTTGLSEVNPACPVAKVLWFKRNKPEVYRQTHKFLLLEDFIIYRLTGRIVTNQGLVTSTGYYDINNDVYWHKLLDLIGIDKNLFPEVLPCGYKVGMLKEEISSELGLDANTMISTGAMDQVASAIGAGNIEPGIITETTGTALVLAVTTDKPDYDHPSRVTIYKHYTKDRYIILPYCATAGIILKWFKDKFCDKEIEHCGCNNTSIYQYLDELAKGVEPGANGIILLPYFAGAILPEMNAYAKGVFYGVGLDSQKSDFVRAILESVGYMLREYIETIEKMGLNVSEIRSIGGASKSSLWNSIKADITGKNIVVLENEESTSLGAAMLGAVSIGLYDNIEDICQQVIRRKQIHEPNPAHKETYNQGYRKYVQLYPCLKNIFIDE